MGKTGTILVAGLVSIGLATTLVMNGHQTAQVAGAAGTAGSNLFKAAEGR